MMEALETETGTKKANLFKIIVFCTVTVVVAVTYLLHIFLPHPTLEVANARKQRDKVRNHIEHLKDSLNILAVQDNYAPIIGREIWYEILDLETVEKHRHEEYLELREQASISGFHSPHKFLWHFGVGLVITALALDMLRTLVYLRELIGRQGHLVLLQR